MAMAPHVGGPPGWRHLIRGVWPPCVVPCVWAAQSLPPSLQDPEYHPRRHLHHRSSPLFLETRTVSPRATRGVGVKPVGGCWPRQHVCVCGGWGQGPPSGWDQDSAGAPLPLSTFPTLLAGAPPFPPVRGRVLLGAVAPLASPQPPSSLLLLRCNVFPGPALPGE